MHKCQHFAQHLLDVVRKSVLAAVDEQQEGVGRLDRVLQHRHHLVDENRVFLVGVSKAFQVRVGYSRIAILRMHVFVQV